MEPIADLQAIDIEVRNIKSAAEKLSRMSENFPALARNTVRILASVKMLELNINDYVALESED
ncbi:hypothetical protein [Desulfosarcina sp.]|uniref:hypothetical protein n=1 Tax=Desulfosarcina sp. TaxID=2027861 RepID=UPI00356623FA